MSAVSPITPPFGLVQKRYSENVKLRFLLSDDNYFSAMRNMWVDFRNNLASRRNFDHLPLPDLYHRAVQNCTQRVSNYDVMTVNMPWVGEFATKGYIRPIGDMLKRAGVNSLDFQMSFGRQVFGTVSNTVFQFTAPFTFSRRARICFRKRA